MTIFALIHGAGDSGSYWHLVEPALRERGYDVVAPDLPADESANLQTYADTVIEAIGDRTGVEVVRAVVRRLHGTARVRPDPDRAPGARGCHDPRAGRADDWWANNGYAPVADVPQNE